VAFGEALALERHGGLLLDRAALEAAQALQRILRPDDRFAELAVAYDIYARLRLLALRCRRPTASSNFRHHEQGIDVESHQLMFAPVCAPWACFCRLIPGFNG
jgi:hypothetical protein